MDKITKNQEFHLILADIAMAMSAHTLDPTFRTEIDAASYQPGSIRDDWLKRCDDKLLNQRVKALANAGIASLSHLAAAVLLEKAERFGIPLNAVLAEDIATHFTNQREAVLTYNR